MGNRAPHLLLISMRPHQWIKNLFVLAPLLFGRKLGEGPAVGQAVYATGVFCLMSASLYLLNDVVDAASDRSHPLKCHRPIASGALSVQTALVVCFALLCASLWLATVLGQSFLVVSTLYCGLMVAYSLGLKRFIVVDAMAIASGFVLRVVGGAVAVDVEASHWLVVCAFLLALYLAFAKRRHELLILRQSAPEHRLVLGEYTSGYLEQASNILAGATIVCYALYTVAPETVARFGTDRLIYGTVFVIYGLLRYMALIQNTAEGGNPGRLLLRDKPLLAAVLGWAIYNALVIYSRTLPALWEGLR
jgi:4-hydroxybenzoate polyprenyltransferase